MVSKEKRQPQGDLTATPSASRQIVKDTKSGFLFTCVAEEHKTVVVN